MFDKRLMHEPDQINLAEFRLDIWFKLHFLRNKNSLMASRAYIEHIHAITNGRFSEIDHNRKVKPEDYTDAFLDIEKSIKMNGFYSEQFIPKSNFGSITNGAHRLAACLQNGVPPSFQSDNKPPDSYGFKFFRERFVEESYLNLAAAEMLKDLSVLRTGILWPTGAQFSNSLESIGKILYTTTIKVPRKNAWKLMALVYEGEDWLVGKNYDMSGALEKANNCFSASEQVTLFIFLPPDSDEELLEKKSAVRKMIGCGKDSIHTCDTHWESIRIFNTLSDERCKKFLAMGNGQFRKKIYEISCEVKLFANKNGIDLSDVLVVGSSPLTLYGLRKANDIDLIYRNFPAKEVNLGKVSSHYDYLSFYSKDVSSCYWSDRHVIKFLGINFLDITEVLYMKRMRSERKDIIDINLINGATSKVGFFSTHKLMRQFFVSKLFVVNCLKRSSLLVRIVKFIRRLFI